MSRQAASRTPRSADGQRPALTVPSPIRPLHVVLVLILFSGVSFLAALLPGVNEPHYLCKARAFADPTWCQADFFLHSSHAHFVFYWLTGPAVTRWEFATVAVAGRLLSLLVVAVGWSRLARAAGLSAGGLCLSAIVLPLLLMSGSFSGEWLIGGYESKVAAWGFCFLAVAAWMTPAGDPSPGPWLRVGVFAGLATAWHPVVGAWLLVALVISESAAVVLTTGRHWPDVVGRTSTVADRPRGDSAGSPADFSPLKETVRRGRFTAAVCVTAGIVALPGLIPAVRLLLNGPLEPGEKHRADVIQVFGRLKHHLDPTVFPASAWLWATGLLALILLAKGIAARSAMANPRPSVPRQLDLLLTAAILIAAAGVAIGWHGDDTDFATADWQWRIRLLKLYPFRLVDMLLPVAAALHVAALGDRVAVNDAILRLRQPRIVQPALLAVLAAVTLCCAAWSARRPSGYSAQQYADWRAACHWIRGHCPPEDLFVTPRESFGFKWFAQRAEYAAWKDCPQDAAGILEWHRRMRLQFRWYETSAADGRLDETELDQLAVATGARWLLTRHPARVARRPAYANETWRLYRIGRTD